MDKVVSKLHELDYAPRPPRLGRRTIWLSIAVGVVLVVIAIGYWQRSRIEAYRQQAIMAWVQWRCLNATTDPSVVVYEEEPAAVQRLLRDSNYIPLPLGTAGRESDQWKAFMKVLGTGTFLWGQRLPAGTVFLHERYTPSGQRMLVWAVYGPDRFGTGRGGLLTLLLRVKSLGTAGDLDCGLFAEDSQVFESSGPVAALPHPAEHKVRIFAGQADPSDRTKFYFDYEIDGKKSRTVVRLCDSDPSYQSKVKVGGR